MTLFQQFLLKYKIETTAYISSEKVIQFINEQDLSDEEKVKFYELIISHNMNLYSSKRKEYEILSRVSTTPKNSGIQEISFSLDKKECTNNQVYGSDSSDFYFEQIKKFNEDDLENLITLLPSRNINNCTFILNKLILKFMKEKVFYEQWKRTLVDEYFDDIDKEIERIDKIINVIKVYRDTKKKVIVD